MSSPENNVPKRDFDPNWSPAEKVSKILGNPEEYYKAAQSYRINEATNETNSGLKRMKVQRRMETRTRRLEKLREVGQIVTYAVKEVIPTVIDVFRR